MHWDTFNQDNCSTVGGDGGCRVGEVRASTTSPIPDHKGFKLQQLSEIQPLQVNFQKFSTLRVKHMLRGNQILWINQNVYHVGFECKPSGLRLSPLIPCDVWKLEVCVSLEELHQLINYLRKMAIHSYLMSNAEFKAYLLWTVLHLPNQALLPSDPERGKNRSSFAFQGQWCKNKLTENH